MNDQEKWDRIKEIEAMNARQLVETVVKVWEKDYEGLPKEASQPVIIALLKTELVEALKGFTYKTASGLMLTIERDENLRG